MRIQSSLVSKQRNKCFISNITSIIEADFKQRNELLVTNVTSIMKVHWKIWSKEINVLSQISHWLYKRIFWEIQTEEINVWSHISHWLCKQIFWDSNQRNKCLTTNLTSIDNNFFFFAFKYKIQFSFKHYLFLVTLPPSQVGIQSRKPMINLIICKIKMEIFHFQFDIFGKIHICLNFHSKNF